MSPLSDPSRLRGRLFPPGAAACRPAMLTLESDGSLRLDAGVSPQTLSPDALLWSSRIGTAARRATLQDGAVFETYDNDHVDSWERAYGCRKVGLVHRLENISAPLLILAALALLAFFIGLRWTAPYLGDAASRFVPHVIEARIGVSALNTLDEWALHQSELPAETQRAILAVFDDLASHAEVPPGSLKLAFRRGDKFVGANALALPGGQIVVTDELVKLAHTPDALAGVFAHEIAHVEHQHGIRRLIRFSGLSVLLTLMTSDLSHMTHDIGALAVGLLDLSYSRDFEHEADTRGTALMRQAGRDPDTLAALLEKLSTRAPSGGSSWLSSHPPTEERVRMIRQAH